MQDKAGWHKRPNLERFYIYNSAKREFVRLAVKRRRQSQEDAGGLYVTWTPSFRYAMDYTLVAAAHKRCAQINAQLGREECQVVSDVRAARLERDNTEYWRTHRC